MPITALDACELEGDASSFDTLSLPPFSLLRFRALSAFAVLSESRRCFPLVETEEEGFDDFPATYISPPYNTHGKKIYSTIIGNNK